MPRNPVTLALPMAYLQFACLPIVDPSGWQCHTFVRRDANADRLPDPEVEFRLRPHPDLAVPGIDQIIDDFTEKYPVGDLAAKDVEPLAGRLVVEHKILGAGAHQHRLPRRHALGEAAAE